jgi:5-methylcytosine-specific restriction endonuclease McrA
MDQFYKKIRKEHRVETSVFASDFYWKQLPKSFPENLQVLHERCGNCVLEILNQKSTLQPLIELLEEGLEARNSFITLIWLHRLDLLLSIWLCLESKDTLLLLEHLQKNVQDDVVKFNILNPTVLCCLECANVQTETCNIIVPASYQRKECVDGIAYLYCPETFESILLKP